MDGDDHQTVTTTEARSGSTPHVTRYVLSIGLILIIIAFLTLIFIYS
jgi:hypothetical protein